MQSGRAPGGAELVGGLMSDLLDGAHFRVQEHIRFAIDPGYQAGARALLALEAAG